MAAPPPPPSYNEATTFPNQGGAQFPVQGAPMPYQQQGVDVPYPQQGTAMPYPQQAGGMPYPQQGMPQPPPAGASPYPPQTGAPPFVAPASVRLHQPAAEYQEYHVDAPKNDDETGILSDNWAGPSFSDKAIRRAFIKRVYLILTAQLLVTVGFIAFFLFHAPMKSWIRGEGFWFYYLSYATFLVTYFVLVCCPSVRRKWPGNFICLAVFTLAFSYMTGTITSYYDTRSVLIAAGITTAVVFSISLFAIQTKIDFTMCSGLLFALSMVLFFFGIACIIVYATIGPNYILQCVYGALAALVFSLFLAYDTQMLMGGHKHQLSPEEHIFGALQLYLDVVYLFLIILSFFGSKN